MSWHPFFRIDEGFTKGVGAVAAVARNPDHLDLFVTGNDGRIYSIYWDDASGWGPFWFRIREGVAQQGSPVTAIARNPDHLDLFVTGNDGGIYSIYWDDASDWGPFWFRIREGVAPQGSPVTAIARNPDHLDLFVTGTDGGIYSIYWDDASDWGPFWFRIGEVVAQQGSAVTAIARNPDHLDLFVTGNDGRIYSTYWDPSPGVLRRVTIKFDTLDDDKEEGGIVSVFVKNRLNNSLTPNSDSDFLSNYFALKRYQTAGDRYYEGRNPYLAFGLALGAGTRFATHSSHAFTLNLFSEHITVDDVVLPQVDIHYLADGT